MTNKYHLNSLSNALQVLSVFIKKQRNLSVADIIKETGFDRTAIYRILYTMIEDDFIIKDKNTNKYGLSVKFYYLGNLYKNNFNIVNIAHKYLVSLANQLEQTSFLSLDIDGKYTIADFADPHNHKPKIPYDKPGAVMPKNCTADGKIFLSQYTEEQIRHIFEIEGFYKGTEKSICDIDSYLKEIDKVKESGYAVNNGETMLYIGAIAVPVYDRYKNIVASLAMGLPPDEQTKATVNYFVLTLKKAADQISAELP